MNRFLRRTVFLLIPFIPELLPIQAGNTPLPAMAPVRTPVPVVNVTPPPAPKARMVARPLSALYVQFNGLSSSMSNAYALNPTGGSVRMKDIWGSGHYNAPRRDLKTRRRGQHNGVDYTGKPGQRVLAPISGELTYVGKGVESGAVISGYINGRKYRVKILHVNMTVPEGYVVQGQTIGRMKNLALWYRGITSHVHVEVHELAPRGLRERNPIRFVRNG